jgi:hypothetical protein
MREGTNSNWQKYKRRLRYRWLSKKQSAEHGTEAKHEKSTSSNEAK